MKHYLYQIFTNTLPSVAKRYLAKYGAESTVREEATTRVGGTTKAQIGFDIGTHDLSTATVSRPALKTGEQAHSNVVVDGRWSSAPAGLSTVKPWDVLMPMGHGLTNAQETQIITNQCCSDPDSRGRTTYRTFNELVAAFGPTQDNLDKDHVLVKLIMCFAGGAGGGAEVPSDCFAKNLAMALHQAGWKTVLVGGYKGELLVTSVNRELKGVTTTRGGASSTRWNEVKLQFTPKTVQYLGATTEVQAKDNLIYFKGDGTVVDNRVVKIVKTMLRNYPADGSQDDQVEYLRSVRVSLGRNQTVFDGFAGDVLKMLVRRLVPTGATTALEEPLVPANRSPQQRPPQPQPQTQTQTQTQTRTQTQTQTQTQSKTPNRSGGKRCSKCEVNWDPTSVRGWNCPTCGTTLTRM